MKNKVLPLFLKIGRKSFKDNWKQFSALIGIGALSTNLFIGLLTNAYSFEDRANKMYKDGDMADIFVTTLPVEKDNDFGHIEEITSPYGVLEKRFYTLSTLGARNALCGISYKMPKVSHPSTIIEESEEQNETNFFIIDQLLSDESIISSKESVIHVGDIAEVSFDLSSFSLDETMISSLDSFLKEGKTNPLKEDSIVLKFKVTGIMQHPENIVRASYSPTLYLASNLVFRNAVRDLLEDRFISTGVNLIFQLGFRDALNWGDGNPYGSTLDFPLANQFLVKMDNKANTDYVRDKIADYFNAKEEDNLLILQKKEETSSGLSLDIDIKQNYQLSFVFPVVFFIVSLLIILTTFRQIIIKDRMNVGTLKALGFMNHEIILYYFIFNSIVITLAFLIGSISAPFVVPLLMEMKIHILYTFPAYYVIYPVGWVIGTFLVFLGISILITYLVIRKEISLKPVESMRPIIPKVIKPIKKTDPKKKEGTIYLSIKMAFRNIFLDPVKSFMVLIGVLGCTSLLCCGFGIEDTINTGIETDPFINSGADITLTYMFNVEEETVKNDMKFVNSDGEYVINGYQSYVRNAIDINHDSYTYSSYIEIVGEYNPIGKEDILSYFPYELSTDGVLISRKVANKLNVGVGDIVSFEYSGEKIEAPIKMVFAAFYNNGIVLPYNSSLFSSPITSFGGSWTSIRSSDRDLALEKINAISYIGSAEPKEGWIQLVKDAISSISYITNAVKVFALMLAVIALYNLGLMNFNERTREVATLKVLGFKGREIALSLLIESLLLVIIGAGIGLFIGYPFMVAVLSVNEVGLIDYIFTISAISYINSILFTVLVGAFINSLLMFKIKKIKMIESLKSIE